MSLFLIEPRIEDRSFHTKFPAEPVRPARPEELADLEGLALLTLGADGEGSARTSVSPFEWGTSTRDHSRFDGFRI